MPNGHNTEYNPDWCWDRHRKIEKQLDSMGQYIEKTQDEVWNKIRSQDRLLWGIMLALIGNMGGVAATLVILAFQGTGNA